MTLDSAPTNGNMLIAVIDTFHSYAPYVSSISQIGVTWSEQVSSSQSALYGRNVEIWAGVISSGASATLNDHTWQQRKRHKL